MMFLNPILLLCKKIRISLHKTVAFATVFHKDYVGFLNFFVLPGVLDMILSAVDMFPQTGDSWICFRKQRKWSESVDMFPYTDDINLIATRHVENVVLLLKDHKMINTKDTCDGKSEIDK